MEISLLQAWSGATTCSHFSGEFPTDAYSIILSASPHSSSQTALHQHCMVSYCIVRACVRACARARVCVCTYTLIHNATAAFERKSSHCLIKLCVFS